MQSNSGWTKRHCSSFIYLLISVEIIFLILLFPLYNHSLSLAMNETCDHGHFAFCRGEPKARTSLHMITLRVGDFKATRRIFQYYPDALHLPCFILPSSHEPGIASHLEFPSVKTFAWTSKCLCKYRMKILHNTVYEASSITCYDVIVNINLKPPNLQSQ